MKLEEFDYHLPKELIAQFPCERRDESRLMALNRKERTISHRRFFELPEYLKAGDVIVLNNTKVIPARLFGKKTTGGAVEVLLIEKSEVRSQISEVWNCLTNPSKGLKKGSELIFEHGLKGLIAERRVGDGWIIELHADISIDNTIELIGKMPLPPYIKRGQGARGKGQEKISELDKERYQTIFAKEKGAIAAPTAGLHFTEGLLKRIKGIGAEIFYINLHKGLGTFMPGKEENTPRHRMAPEYYKISPPIPFIFFKSPSVKCRPA